MAAALTPMAAVFAVCSVCGVYAVRTVASWPALIPCSSITGGGVAPSSRIRPVKVEGNKLIYI